MMWGFESLGKKLILSETESLEKMFRELENPTLEQMSEPRGHLVMILEMQRDSLWEMILETLWEMQRELLC